MGKMVKVIRNKEKHIGIKIYHRKRKVDLFKKLVR